jgi:hypothetical protein
MKRLLVLLVLFVVGFCESMAQDGTQTYAEMIASQDAASRSNNAAAPFFGDLHVTLSDTIASRYWGSIVGGIFYTGGPVNFTTLNFSLDDKWGSTYTFVGMINPLDTLKYDYHGGTEYFLAVGRTIELWKGGSKNLPLLKLNGMVLYDAVSRIDHWNDDVVQQYLRLDVPRVPIAQPYLECYNWIQSGHKSPPVSWFARAGIHRQQPMGVTFQKSEMELGIDLSAGYSGDGLFGTSEGLAYYRAVISTEFKVNKHLSIVPSIVGQLPGDQKPKAFVDRARLFYNLTLSWAF